MNVYSKLSPPLSLIDSRLNVEFNRAVDRCAFSGASLLISSFADPVYERTWGAVESAGVPVTPTTRFDLASLTKPLVTAPLCMVALTRGLLDLDDPISRFFPGLARADKKKITVGKLLSHSSGLPAYEPFYLELIKLPPEDRKNALTSMILKTPLESLPGQRAVYSDPGFMLLGLILEQQMQGGLDRLAKEYLFDPLGIEDLHFCPLPPALDPAATQSSGEAAAPAPVAFSPGSLGSSHRAGVPGICYAATQFCPWRKRLLSGEVDDENAWTLNGVSGHAGLFGTSRGIFKLLSFLWSVYIGETAHPLWDRKTLELFWKKTELAEGPSDWCLGYDTPSRKGYSSAGRYFSSNSIGHLGFTGVSFWLDLEKKILVIMLTNRVHPARQNDEIRELRPILHDIIMGTLTQS